MENVRERYPYHWKTFEQIKCTVQLILTLKIWCFVLYLRYKSKINVSLRTQVNNTYITFAYNELSHYSLDASLAAVLLIIWIDNEEQCGMHAYVNWSYIDFRMDFGNLSNNCVSFFDIHTSDDVLYFSIKVERMLISTFQRWWIMIVKHSIILCFISHFSFLSSVSWIWSRTISLSGFKMQFVFCALYNDASWTQ